MKQDNIGVREELIFIFIRYGLNVNKYPPSVQDTFKKIIEKHK